MTTLAQRKTPRALWHDYAGGLYFVTAVTHNRQHFFGHINKGKMHLTGIGAFLDQQLTNISAHYPYATSLNHCVMPNHMHSIIYIEHKQLPHELRPETATNSGSNTLANARLCIGWLSVVMGGIKSSVTKYARLDNEDFAWQTRFHDRIVRNRQEFEMISNYIDTNVERWEQDCFNDGDNVGTGRALSENPPATPNDSVRADRARPVPTVTSEFSEISDISEGAGAGELPN